MWKSGVFGSLAFGVRNRTVPQVTRYEEVTAEKIAVDFFLT
jgi:hypothetical protein